METVNKGSEPTTWRNHRLTPGADFEATPGLKFELLKEGGFVCAYCQRRIPCSDPLPEASKEQPNDLNAPLSRADKMHVEHVWPRELMDTPQERMDYRNLVACCPGFIKHIPIGRNSSRNSSHCDHRKGSRVLHLNIFQQNLSDRFSFDTNIKSESAGKIEILERFMYTPTPKEMEWLDNNRPGWDKKHGRQLDVTLQNEIGPLDITHLENILNLNHPTLRENRIAVIKAIQTAAKKNGGKRSWWEMLLNKFSTMSTTYPYPNPYTGKVETFPAYQPYRSIAIHYIKKKLRQF